MTRPINTLVDKAAYVLHMTNKAWCEANGDFSQPHWDDMPDWQYHSIKDGMDFHMNNPNAGDSASHDNWMKMKLNEGWVYGPIKNPEANPPTHPCLVPFEELPHVQQVKDALFRAVFHAILKD